MCKVKLEQICEDTDGLLHVIRQAIDKTSFQVRQAEADINDACDNVKSTFKFIHKKLDEEDKEMTHDLQAAGRRVRRLADVILDKQYAMVSELESSKVYQAKLTEKASKR